MTSEVVAELRTLGDVEAVEVELESVSASAEQRVAEARTVPAAVKAEQQRHEAESAAEEALTAETRAREAAQAAERRAERTGGGRAAVRRGVSAPGRTGHRPRADTRPDR